MKRSTFVAVPGQVQSSNAPSFLLRGVICQNKGITVVRLVGMCVVIFWFQANEYFEMVSEPMSLSQVEHGVNDGVYATVEVRRNALRMSSTCQHSSLPHHIFAHIVVGGRLFCLSLSIYRPADRVLARRAAAVFQCCPLLQQIQVSNLVAPFIVVVFHC